VIDTWFGRDGAETLGFVHVPAGGARAGVVICPPLGYEQFNAYRAMRYLGQQLEARGLAAVRFDYAGEGDAVGEPGRADAVERWLGTVADAVALLRHAGIDDIALVGLSSGALIAAEAARRSAPSALVLWDPAFSGRRFLRRQRSLRDLVVAPEAAGAVPILSTTLHPDTARWIDAQRIDAGALASITTETLVLARSSGAREPELGAGVEVRVVDGQEDLLDVPSAVATTPAATVTAIAEWLSERHTGAPRLIRVSARTEVEVGSTEDGEPIVERLSRRGAEKLFTIETVRTSGADRGSVLLQPAAAEHRAGAGRFQVRTARALAERGFSAVRFDRRITGDSTEVHPGEQNLVLAEPWVDDAAALVDDLPESRLALIGVCSGAWGSARIAAERATRLVVLVGPNYYRTAAMAPDEYASAVRETGGVEPRSARAKSLVRDGIPNWLWRLLAGTQVFNNPATLLAAPARRGAGTIALLLPPEDVATFDRNRGTDAVTRLRARGTDVRVTPYDEGDHAMLGEAVQARALADILRLVDETMPAAAPTVTAGAPR
jgi:alpha-beta hydrolase superfamily lysophospholipase